MKSILVEILEFSIDVFLLRRARRARGLKEHQLEHDVADMANMYFLGIVLSVTALAAMFVLYFGLNWPFWLSFGLPTAAATGYSGLRLKGLYRNPD
ncbi:MAG: hypothetical protein LBD10_05305 [Desulfobulbus sp.]|jgi:hypothetical protein|uniref:hypothetical protein n=1 Tax=Desulfobulbus sp. TaxID=895 RepID=UPI00283FAD69|nr:hypothetical protein [Desulfobulbus sp.]MDR2549603.1 hypothetical protein [Desulfobulbus sp.]